MNKVNEIYKQCESLSLFELNQLRNAISNILKDEDKNAAVKQHLKVGMKISYFNSKLNDFFNATITDIRQTRLSVKHDCTGEVWNTKFHTINLNELDTRVESLKSSGGLDRNSLKVGDYVGWKDDQTGLDVFGVITKLNPKRAKVTLANGDIWLIYYSSLFAVTDGSSSSSKEQLLIEGKGVWQ